MEPECSKVSGSFQFFGYKSTKQHLLEPTAEFEVMDFKSNRHSRGSSLRFES